MKTSFKIFSVLLALIGIAFITASVVSGANNLQMATLGFDALNITPVADLINHVHPVGLGTGLAFNFAALTVDASIGWQDGDEDMGGYGVTAYLGLYSHIETWPTIPANPTTMAELVTLVGNFVMATNKHFIKVKLAPNSLELNPESQGENVGQKSFNIKGSFIFAGSKSEQRAYARMLNNASGCLIIPDGNERICVGSEDRPITFKPKGKSGKKATDAKEFVYEFETDSFVPGYTYNGTVILDTETLPEIS